MIDTCEAAPELAAGPAAVENAPADTEREADSQALDMAFRLAGVVDLGSRYAEEHRVLEVYRAGLEEALDHPATPADLAAMDNARRCRGMILVLTRKVYTRGFVTKTGTVRGEVAELRAWIRLELDALSRLAFRDGRTPKLDLNAYIAAKAGSGSTAPASRVGPVAEGAERGTAGQGSRTAGNVVGAGEVTR